MICSRTTISIISGLELSLNVQGVHFFTLHAKFEELYNNALTTIDELAEGC